MNDGPKIKGNPLRISVFLLVISYVIGDFIMPTYPINYFIKIIGIIGLIISISFFISGFRIFKIYGENPNPSSSTTRLIKTGIFAYTRNPIYVSFVLFFISMFLVFENVMYFLSSIGLGFWLHHWVIKVEENFLEENFYEEFSRYKKAVKRWLFF